MLLRLPAAVRWFTVSPSLSLSLSFSLCVLLTDSFMDSELGPNANPGIHIGAVYSRCSPAKMDRAEAATAEGKCEGSRVSFCFCPCVCVCVCVLFPQSHTHTHTHSHSTAPAGVTAKNKQHLSSWVAVAKKKMQIRPGTPRGNANVLAPNDGTKREVGRKSRYTGRRWMGGRWR